MAKPFKGKKSPEQQGSQTNTPEKKVSLSGKFLDTLKDSLTDFAKLSETERSTLYGNQAFLDQFWEYFKKEQPDLLGGLKKEELPAYLTALEKKGFSLHTINQDSEKLHAEFRPEKPEREVMQETLGKFDAFCRDTINNIPAGTFKKFADEAGFDHETYRVTSGSKLQTIDDLYIFRKKFVEKENITLKDEQKKNIEQVLCPAYDPVERVMVEVAITKLRKELPNKLHDAFDRRFPKKLTAFTSLSDLRTFKQEWLMFLDENASQIDQKLAKKLDSVIVTNGDIRSLLMISGKKFDHAKGFEEREHYFLRVFNKLATRQLFEEVKATKEAIEKYVDVIHEGVRGFPPYVNELFKLYPYDDQSLSKTDSILHTELNGIDTQITETELAIANDATSKEEKARLRKKRKELKQQREEIKRKAYIRYLATKDQALAGVMDKLVGTRFDFNKLSVADQQVILNILVKQKLNDLIAHKAPELLGIDAGEFKQFTDNLFDLSNKNLTIPTKEGPVHIVFKEKKFLPQQANKLLGVNELADLKSLPLQFVIEPTPSSQEFFEKGILWGNDGGMLFDTFQSKNGPVILNDGYKVKLTKDGKTVEGYLSQYPPADVAADTKEDKTSKGESWYMYSKPVTDVTQERKRVTWEGTDQGTAVVIPETEEGECSLLVTDKSFALNGEAIGSLIFAYVLGQQSFYNEISPDQEKALAKKLGKIDEFIDTQGNRVVDEEETEEQTTSDSPEQKEKTEYDKFLDGWKTLSGYDFPEDKENAGFKVGSKVFIKAGESALPPNEERADAWMYLDIKKINKEKGTFTVSLHGGEYGLGKNEGVKKEIPLRGASWDKLKDILGSEMYKVPPMKNVSFDTQLTDIKNVFGKLYPDHFSYTFDTVKADGDGFTFTQGDLSGEKVAAFGFDIKVPEYVPPRTIEKIKTILFDVKRKSNGDYHVSCQNDLIDAEGNQIEKFSRDMDPVSFALFVAGKKLQPKADKQAVEAKKLQEADADRGFNKKKQRFSIKNIASFFKNSVGKVTDSMKKYDEERAEDLTDIMLQNGDLFNKFGKAIGGISSRMGESMEAAGLEYYTTRDSRIWKKIEKWQKMYEQEKHYPTFFYHSLNDMLTGKEVPRDMYKIPAMLLTIINKEKSPYARHFDLIGKGQWVNMILGKEHQQRYLGIMNRKIADMRQNSALNGTDWTVNSNQEIVKLEMDYLVSVIDMREHGIADQEIYQSGKWSRAFAEKLDEAMRTKFGFGEINTKHSELSKSKTTTFEFAEFEFARHTRNGKAAAAFPFFKVMAEQAQTQAQWEQFEMHVVSSTLSGWFQFGTDGDTKGWLKDICRSRGFIPGLFAKDINQQSKMLGLINIFLKSSGKKFEDAEMKRGKPPQTYKFSPEKYCMGNMGNSGAFVADGFKQRWFKNENGKKFSKFLELTREGKDSAGKKTMIELAEDPTLSNSDRALLIEYIGLTNETSQDIDTDVKRNPAAMAGSPFTKCETIVKELLKYDDAEFEGKDSHEKAGPAEFWKKVANGIPKGQTSETNIVFYIGKFLNWFDGYGFGDGSQKTEFIKRLLTVKKMFAKPDPALHKQAEDMLWYIINGMILKANSAGKGSPPKEFEAALNAFKNFFKSNLDQILSPHMLKTTMGDFYAKDEDTNTPYEIGNWSEYVEVMENRASLIGDKTGKNKEISKKYNSGTYAIYKELYDLAKDLDRNKGQRNLFKSYYKYKPASAASTGAAGATTGATPRLANSGIAINNPQVTRQADITNTLTGKDRLRNTSEAEELISMMEPGESN